MLMHEIDTAAEMHLEPFPTYIYVWTFFAKIVNALKKAPS